MNQEDQIGMVYNSQRTELILPEYGRNFQKLVNYCKTIEDAEYRQAFAEQLINLMVQMQPSYKNTLEYHQKMWNQLMFVADFDLDVKVPEGIKIRSKSERLNPDRLEYPGDDKPFRHYGNQVLTLIKKAIDMEDGPQKNTFINVIGSYMKLAYKTWNREHYVNDEVIKSDMKKMSGGKLNIPDEMRLDYLAYDIGGSASTNKRKPKRSGSPHRNKGKQRRKK